jgi:hypothetical protein
VQVGDAVDGNLVLHEPDEISGTSLTSFDSPLARVHDEAAAFG